MKWVAALTAFLPYAANAATIVALPEPELSRKADAIVFGTIIAATTSVSKGGHVVTSGELQVYRSVRGPAAGSVVTLKVPGGRLPNGLVASAAGAPKLEPGQLVFGFLEMAPDGAYRSLGLAYGLLVVHKAADGTFRVSRNTDGLAMMTPAGGAAAPDTYRIVDVPLDELMARVAKHIGQLGPVDPGFGGPGGTVQP